MPEIALNPPPFNLGMGDERRILGGWLNPGDYHQHGEHIYRGDGVRSAVLYDSSIRCRRSLLARGGSDGGSGQYVTSVTWFQQPVQPPFTLEWYRNSAISVQRAA